MTTIAWDGVTLAADTLASSDGFKRRVHKLTQTESHLFGMAGYERIGIAIARWVKAGCDLDKRPTVDETGSHGLLIERATLRAFIVEGESCELLPVLDIPFAVGSGRDFAIAAMMFGKSAAEAVAFASRFDLWTGSEVETIPHQDA